MPSLADMRDIRNTYQEGRRRVEQARQAAQATKDAAERAQRNAERALKRVGELWSDNGETFEETDAHELTQMKEAPEQESFPLGMLMVALFKDFVIDIAGTILWVLLIPINALIIVSLFIWMKGKLKGRWWKKIAIRAIVLMAVEIFVPGFNVLVPGTTILVFMAHYRSTKVVRLLNESLEILHKHKIV